MKPSGILLSHGTSLFKQVWLRTFPKKLWKQVTTTGLTDLDEIAKRADLLQECQKLEQLLLLVPPREVQLHLFIINGVANLWDMDPAEEREKTFSWNCVTTMPNLEVKHMNVSRPALGMIGLKP